MIPAHRAPLETNQQRHQPAEVLIQDIEASDEVYWYCVLMFELNEARETATKLFARLMDTDSKAYSWAKCRIVARQHHGNGILTFTIRRPRGQ